MSPTRRVRLAVGTAEWGALPVWRTCARCGAGVWLPVELADAQYVSCRECALRTNAPPVRGLVESSSPAKREAERMARSATYGKPPAPPTRREESHGTSLAWLGVGTGFALATLALSAALLAGTEAGDPWANLSLWVLVVLAGTASLGATFHGLGTPRPPVRVAPEAPRGPVGVRSGSLSAWRARARLRRAERRGRALQRRRLTVLRDAERAKLWDALKAEAFDGDAHLRERFVEWDDEESARIEADLYDDLRALYPNTDDAGLAKLVASWRVLARDLPVGRRAEP